jgi:hypothetical protein
MDAKSSAGVPLSSPAAAQRCAEGAGLDSGAPAAAQSAMPSIAAPCHRTDRRSLSTNAAAPAAPQLQPRISTSLTDVTPTPRAASIPLTSAHPRKQSNIPARTVFTLSPHWRLGEAFAGLSRLPFMSHQHSGYHREARPMSARARTGCSIAIYARGADGEYPRRLRDGRFIPKKRSKKASDWRRSRPCEHQARHT